MDADVLSIPNVSAYYVISAMRRVKTVLGSVYETFMVLNANVHAIQI
jgi:hypothetical protein